MSFLIYFSYFFGGAFLANAIPHLVSGQMGRAFQSPFASPPGKGLSSSVVNVVWGMFNCVVAYLLLVHVGEFDIHSFIDVGIAGLGALLVSLHLSYHFGQFHGGRISKVD